MTCAHPGSIPGYRGGLSCRHPVCTGRIGCNLKAVLTILSAVLWSFGSCAHRPGPTPPSSKWMPQRCSPLQPKREKGRSSPGKKCDFDNPASTRDAPGGTGTERHEDADGTHLSGPAELMPDMRRKKARCPAA